MAKVKIGPLAPSIYCVHQRIAVQIAAAVDADQPDWRNRLAAVRRCCAEPLARHSVGAGRTKRLSWVGCIAAEPSGVRRLSTAPARHGGRWRLLNLRRFT
jgi:hypothetical protein